MHVDSKRLLRLTLAGALAGLAVFLIFNPWLVREEAKYSIVMNDITSIDAVMNKVNSLIKHLSTPDPVGAFLFTGAFAGLVGGFLTLADQIGLAAKRVAQKVALAMLSGIVIGGVSGVIADQLVTSVAPKSLGSITAATRIITMIPIMYLGWLLMAVGSAVAVGITLGSRARLMASIWGGLVGGIVGRMVFDMFSGMPFVQTGSIGRLFGFMAMGAAIGAGVSLAEDIGKRFWVTVLSGPKEGRSYIIAKPTTTIGRDELADIPLFADASVAKLHATLKMFGYAVTFQGENGAPVAVNGSQVSSPVQLRQDDILSVGQFSLRFHAKYTQRYIPANQQYAPTSPSPGGLSNPHQTIALNTGVRPAAGSLALTITLGPYTNRSGSFNQSPILIGREPDCALNLYDDHAVSRHHAEITWSGSAWFIRDLGSVNGILLNGAPYQSGPLNIGDQISLGQSILRVDGV